MPHLPTKPLAPRQETNPGPGTYGVTVKSIAGRALVLAFMLFAWPAGAQDNLRIAAVVNDDVISVFDLRARVALVVRSTGLDGSPDLAQQMAGPVLRTLIDESLQIGEAESQGITLSDVELNAALSAIEQRNGVAAGGLEEWLRAMGIPRPALVGQLRAQLTWTKYVNQRLRPQIQIGTEDVDEEVARLEALKGQPEHLISEIDLYVDDPARRAEVLDNARRLVEQVRAGGDFAAIARQFSQGSMAAAGGDLGWVQDGQTRPEIDAALAALDVGEVSDPIATLEGYHIVRLRDRRQVLEQDDSVIQVRLIQVLLPLTDDRAEIETQHELARVVSETVRGCADMYQVVEELDSSSSGDIGWLRMGDLPNAFRDAVRDLQVGFPSAPLTTEAGLHVLMVCERKDPNEGMDLRDEVRARLTRERLDVLARRLLRDIRRAAFIDIRV